MSSSGGIAAAAGEDESARGVGMVVEDELAVALGVELVLVEGRWGLNGFV